MPAIFTRRAGTVIAIPAAESETPPQVGIIRVEGINGDLRATGDIIIVGFQAPSSVSYKATSTIGGPKYLTTFGDNLTQITVSVVLFQGDGCDREFNGILSGFRFYADNRLKADSTPIVKIAYGGVTIEGFLIGYTPSSQVQAGLQVHIGSFSIIGWVNADWFTRTAGEDAPHELGHVPDFKGDEPTTGDSPTPSDVPYGGTRSPGERNPDGPNIDDDLREELLDVIRRNREYRTRNPQSYVEDQREADRIIEQAETVEAAISQTRELAARLGGVFGLGGGQDT